MDFSVDKNQGCGTVQSQFSDLSSSTAGDIVSWSWEIGEVSSTLKNPGRVFTDVGTYDVCLTVEDSEGNSATECRNDFIAVYGKPEVDFLWDESIGCAPLLVNFTSNASSPNGAISEWNWGLGGTFGSITTSSDEVVSTSYEEDGFHTVSLQVIDDKGCEQSVTKLDIIKVEERPEIIIGSAEAIGCKFPMTVDFENFGLASNVIYEWDFGNGETYEGYDPDPVTYATANNYSIIVSSRFSGSECRDEVQLIDYISEGGAIDFDFSPKQGCKGLLVQFEDLSTIQAETWEWDFGDGNTSDERDPEYLYQEPGTYTITLYRRTAECEGTKVSQHQIVVTDNPVISGSFSNDAGCSLPATIQLSASGDDDNNYSWFVGESEDEISVPNGKNVEVDITDFGTYKLSLIASSPSGCKVGMDLDSITIAPLEVTIEGNTDGCVPFLAELELSSNVPSELSIISSEFSGDPEIYNSSTFFNVQVDEEESYDFTGIFENNLGCRDTLNIPSLIRGGPAPVADFTVSDSAVCPLVGISFTDLSTGDIDYWSWDIGDSLEYGNADFIADYSLPGNYDIELTVGSNGCLVSKKLEDFITVKPPGVNFEIEYNCTEANSIVAINKSSQADSLIWTYTENGSTTVITNQDTISISFPDDDQDYLLSLTGYNLAAGCDNTASQAVDIRKPKASFQVSETMGCAPLRLDLTDSSEDAVEWEYIPSGASYTSPGAADTELILKIGGTYENIGLVVTDIHGCTDTTFSEAITVNGIRAKFGAPEPICYDDTLSITNFSSTTFGSITSYKWVLGDNEQVSYEPMADFTSDEVGKYDIKLVVENDWGCMDSTVLGLGAFFRAPNFDLVTDSLACTSSEVRFRNGLHAPGYNYVWSFGDGTMSTEINPTHLYSMEGNYEVNVTIEDDQKCANDQDISSLIQVYNPVASFSVDSTYAPCPPLVSTFTNESENAVSYQWNFGDETSESINEDPTHLFSYGGMFDVELIATRSELCADTLRVVDLVQLDGPSGTISFTVDSSCVPLMVSLDAILDEEYTMVWDFGDGNLLEVEEATDSASTTHSYGDAGNFIPKIILTNNENCTIVRQGENIVAHDIEASFELPQDTYCDEIPPFVSLASTSYSSSPIESYSWTVTGAINQNLSGISPTISGSALGFSSVELIAESAFCSDTVKLDSILRIGPSPVILPLQDTFTCLGNSVLVAYTAALENEVVSWLPEDMEGYVPEVDEFYILRVENEIGCVSYDSLWVSIINDKTPFLGEDRTICEGSETMLSVDYGTNVDWLSDLGCDGCNSITISPDSFTIFSAKVINEYGCDVLDTIAVDVLTQDDIDAGDDQKVCQSQSTILLGYAPGNYSWSPSSTLSHASDYITGATPIESTTYTLTSTKGECTLRDSVIVEVIQKAELETRGDTICYGEEGEIYAGGLVDMVYWIPDPTLSASDLANPSVTPLINREYMVVGELEGCVSDTAFVSVMVHPELVASLPAEVNYFPGTDQVELGISNLSSSTVEILWSPASLINCVDCPSVVVPVNGELVDVQALITDTMTMCQLSKSVTIRQLDKCAGAEETIWVPNIFSPNDDGVNDLLEVEAPLFGDIELMNIYDRWGHRVFSTTSAAVSWDGMTKGGRAQAGVYTFSLTALCPEDGTVILKTGDVTIIR